MNRFMVVFGPCEERGPILRMTVEFLAADGYEEEYARKLERALAPVIEIVAGPWPFIPDKP